MSENLKQVENNRNLFLRFQEEVINQHDWRAETLAKYVKSGFVDHSTSPGNPPEFQNARAPSEVWRTAFSEYKETNLEVFGESDYLAVMFEWHARHVGEFLGIEATDRTVTVPEIRIMRFEDGLIAENWAIHDYLTTSTQLDARIVIAPKSPQSAATTGGSVGTVGHGSVLTKATAASLQSEISLAKAKNTVARNKDVLLGFQRDVFNSNDWSIPTLSKYLQPDIIDHNAFPGDPPGLEGVQYRFSAWQSAFGDADEEYLSMLGDGDILAVLYDLHAEHSGDYMGIAATNAKVVIPGIEVLRFEDGMMAEHWGIYDFMATAQQIGAELKFEPRSLESVA